jgi:hypothetical protein
VDRYVTRLAGRDRDPRRCRSEQAPPSRRGGRLRQGAKNIRDSHGTSTAARGCRGRRRVAPSRTPMRHHRRRAAKSIPELGCAAFLLDPWAHLDLGHTATSTLSQTARWKSMVPTPPNCGPSMMSAEGTAEMARKVRAHPPAVQRKHRWGRSRRDPASRPYPDHYFPHRAAS